MAIFHSLRNVCLSAVIVIVTPFQELADELSNQHGCHVLLHEETHVFNYATQ